MSEYRKISVTVNGTLRQAEVPVDLPLINFLQDDLHLTGTKFCCGIGVCRACTVAVWRTPKSVPDVMLTCVTKAVDVDGQSIGTVEGLANGNVLTPLQQAFLDEYAFQCGYSTPGFLMAGEVLLQQLKISPIPVIEYARQCAAVTAEIETFDCHRGALLPITVDGKTPAKYTKDMKCDRPAMAPGNDFPCAPYSRALLLRDDTVQIGAYCRQMSLRSAASAYYDEIDVIVHSRVNGATCWFSASAKTKKGVDGTKVPPPTSRGAEKFWDPPAQVVKGNCVSCHDSDPWMYSPFLGQTNQYPVDPFGYYTNAIGPFKAWPEPSAITARGNNCTSCHRIGNMETCKTAIHQATGGAPIKGADKWAKTYPHSHWMPPGNSLTSRQWHVTYDPAMKELERCCADPKAPGCEVTPIRGK